MKDYNETIGAVFAQHRKEKGYSQQYVADRMNVTRSTIHYWEKGKRQMFAYQFFDLCKIYGLDANTVADEVVKYGNTEG